MLIDQIKDVPHVEQKIFDAIKASSLPVVLFGAGGMVRHVLPYLRQHAIEPICICDNDAEKQGSLHLGLPVFGYKVLKEKLAAQNGKCTIVVTVGPQNRNAVFAQLAGAGEENPVWYLHGYELYGEKLTYDYFRDHAAQFEEAYVALADDRSRTVFVNVLNAKLSGEDRLFRQVAGGAQYFESNIVKLTDQEVLLDVGAYKGSSIVEFARRTDGRYEAIIAVEPDKETFSILKDAINGHRIRKTELCNTAVWDKTGTLKFEGGCEGSSCISASAAAPVATSDVTIDTIDNLLHGRRVTYITMDIEGAERMAILGARQSIVKWVPRMAISVYHRREDLFDLLLLIRSIAPQYQFFMRHYTDNQTETILYAVNKS